ncbi:MAG: hypothetical protein ACTHN5_09290 [Phycisphaerae bacterium]
MRVTKARNLFAFCLVLPRARLGLDGIPSAKRRGYIFRAFSIVFITAIVVGALGLVVGMIVVHRTDLSGWNDWRDQLGLRDVPSFVIAAYLHGGSYLGALLGVIFAGVYVRRGGSPIVGSGSAK